MSRLSNKVIIVTGSSIGIGKAMAGLMAKEGAQVVLNARNEERLVTTQQYFKESGFDMLAIAGDVSKPEHCKQLLEETIQHFGKVDVLVNNAGISMEGNVAELNPEVFEQVMNVNFLGSVYPTQYAIPHLKKTKGSIIFMGSLAGIYGLPKFSAYCSSKMALTALAQSLQIELEKDQIHVGIAYVGFTKNDPQKTIFDKDGNIIPQPQRGFVKAEPVEVVVERIIQMILKRQSKKVFTPIGKLNEFLTRFSPILVKKILARNYQNNVLCK